jgi:hypothetical protein
MQHVMSMLYTAMAACQELRQLQQIGVCALFVEAPRRPAVVVGWVVALAASAAAAAAAVLYGQVQSQWQQLQGMCRVMCVSACDKNEKAGRAHHPSTARVKGMMLATYKTPLHLFSCKRTVGRNCDPALLMMHAPCFHLSLLHASWLMCIEQTKLIHCQQQQQQGQLPV